MSGPEERGLLGTTARIAVLKAFSSAASAGVIVVTARQLGPDGRGVFVLLFTLATFAMLVCSLGVATSAKIQLVAAEAQVESGDYFGLVTALTALQAGVCTVAAAVILPQIDVRLDGRTIGVFTLLGVSIFATFMTLEALNAYGHTVDAAVVDTVGSLVQLALVVGVAWRGIDEVGPFLAALAASYLLQIVLAVAALYRQRIALRPRARSNAWRALLAHGPSGMAIQLGQQAVFKLDRYFIALFLTPAAVGVYSVASAFPEMLRIVPTAMALPVLYGLASGTSTDEDFVRARRLCLAVMIAAGLVVIALAPLAVRLLFGDEYDGAVAPLRLLIVAEVALAMYYIDGAALTGQGRVRETASAVLTGLVVAAVAYVALIDPLGINGAAIGSLVAYTAMAIVARHRLRRGPVKLSSGG